MLEGLSGRDAERRTVMINATYLKAQRRASNDRMHQGWHEHHASRRDGCDRVSHQLLITAGHAAAQLDGPPKVQWLLGAMAMMQLVQDDLQAKGLPPCVPARGGPNPFIMTGPISKPKPHYDYVRRLKDWRRAATR